MSLEQGLEACGGAVRTARRPRAAGVPLGAHTALPFRVPARAGTGHASLDQRGAAPTLFSHREVCMSLCMFFLAEPCVPYVPVRSAPGRLRACGHAGPLGRARTRVAPQGPW
ncbi:hypothetical protein GCM10027075_21850 [Streptomyces heilongjiangensis]